MTTPIKTIISICSFLLVLLVVLLGIRQFQTTQPVQPTSTPQPTNAPSESPVGRQVIPTCPAEQIAVGMARALQNPATVCQLLLAQPDAFEQLAANATKFTNLKIINAPHNQYQHIPPEIGQITSLIMLELNNNQLATLPDSFKELKNLSLLDLRNNAFSQTERERIMQLTPAVVAF